MWDEGAHHMRVYLVQAGADVTAEVYVDGTLSMSGTITSVTLDGSFTPNLVVGEGAYVVWSHVAVWAGAGPSASDSYEAATGHVGETATDRIARNCLEEGIPHAAVSPTDDPQMGPQPIGDILAVLRDAETVGHGILYETLDSWGIGYRPLEDRYNLSPAMTIDLSTYRTSEGTSARVLQPVRNDRRLRNEWTVSRPGGGRATAIDAVSQSRRGRYNDSAEVNVAADTQLADEAGWRVREDADESMRYAGFPIDLGANASTLLPAWLEMELGDRVDRTGAPAEHPGGTVSVEVEGYVASIRRRSWMVDIASEPFEPWRVQQLSATPPASTFDGRLIASSWTVDADFDAGVDPSLDVDVTPAITQNGDHIPFNIRTSGVLLEVTAVGAPAGSVQTLTVTQTPLNGATKTITAGTAVELADPLILVL
jgi:hypothetical protein